EGENPALKFRGSVSAQSFQAKSLPDPTALESAAAAGAIQNLTEVRSAALEQCRPSWEPHNQSSSCLFGLQLALCHRVHTVRMRVAFLLLKERLFGLERLAAQLHINFFHLTGERIPHVTRDAILF